MKKIAAAGILSIVLLTACKNDVPSAPAEPASVPATPPPAIPEKPTPEVDDNDGTSVKVGSDGISVKSKDGVKKTDVEVGGGKASVEVK